MTTSTAPAKRPTFGHLRKPRKAGLNSLSFGATALLFLGVLGFIVASLFPGLGLLAAIVWLLGCVVLALLLQLRSADELTLLQRAARRLTFRSARGSGANLYRSGLLGVLPSRAAQLPGLLADTELVTAWDSYGREFALVHHRATGDHVAVFAAEPDGSALVDAWEIDHRVAYWGAVLATFGDEPGLAAAAVTIESAPDPGHRLARAVENAIEPGSPPIAQAMLREVVARYPEGSAMIRGYIALTFTAVPRPGARKRSSEEIARELASRLPKLSDRLVGAGTGLVRPLTAGELAEVVHVAYHPGKASVIEEVRARGEDPGLDWSEVGPIAHDNRWDHYVHDDGVSTTWQMTAPPRGTFSSDVLSDLLAPHRDIPRKRVTMLFETVPADRAADIVQKDLNDAEFRASSSVRPSARVRADARAADNAADAEAAGAGVVNVGLLVTATVLDPGLRPGEQISRRNRNRSREERLARAADDAVAGVDSLSGAARVRLRKLYASQDAAFAAALPIGLNLAKHLRVPAELREAM